MKPLPAAPLRLLVACLLLATPIAASAQPRSAADHPLLRIAGSDQMGAVMSALATEYRTRTPGFLYELDARGSATAPPLLLRGEVQIAAMTRDLSSLEQRAFDARYGRQPLGIAVAVDAVAIVVNAANPVKQLNLQQVDSIFSATRRCGGRGRPIRTWGETDASDWAERRIGVVVTPRTSGTRAYFQQIALCGGKFVDGAREMPGANSVLRALVESPDSIGYASRAALTPAARAVSLEGRFGKLYSPTTYEHVRSGKYPLVRSLYLYAMGAESGKLNGPPAEFIGFVLSEAGQRVVEQQGFLPLTAEDAAKQRKRLD